MDGRLEVSLPKGLGVADYPPGAAFGPRRMRDFEFVWVLHGSARYFRDERLVAEVGPGGIILCLPNATDRFEWDARLQTRHAYVHFNVRSVPRDWPKRRDWPVARVPVTGDVLRPLLQHLLRWSRDPTASAALLRLTLQHLLTAFVLGQYDATEPPNPPMPEPVELALAAIYRRLNEDPAAPVTLDDLAREAFVTAPHLCRLFRRATGHSPAETVRMARLDRAVQLVARSSLPIKRIAALHGFVDQPHFTRCFTRAFGRSPQQVRDAVAAGRIPPLPILLRRWAPPGR